MKIKNILLAVILYAFMSLSSVFMKLASLESSITKKMFFYVASIFTLGIFAILWQKLLKKFDLSKVYVFKATTIIWGMLFGYMIFHENINYQMIIGALITVIGVIVIIREEKQ